MGFFNDLITNVQCSHCHGMYEDRIQFKFGHTCQLEYRLGDKLKWLGGNDIGEPGMKKVKVYGIMGGELCPVCGKENEEVEFDILVEDDVLIRIDKMTDYDYWEEEGGCYKVLVRQA